MKVNPETQFTEASGKLTQDGFNALQEIADAAEGGDTGTPGSGIIDAWHGTIDIVEEKEYPLIGKAAFAGTVNETTTKSSAGTATFTFAINGVPLAGTPNDVSTVEQDQAHSATFVAGDRVTVTATTNSSCEDAEFTIKYTRA